MDKIYDLGRIQYQKPTGKDLVALADAKFLKDRILFRNRIAWKGVSNRMIAVLAVNGAENQPKQKHDEKMMMKKYRKKQMMIKNHR